MSIQDLIGRIQINEDESAFNELYKLYVGKLDDYAYSILSDREAAEEIVNDVFVKIWKSRKTIDSIKNLQVYLFVAVKNGCLNYLRSVSSKKLRELELSEAYYFHLSADPAQLLIKKETHNEIVKAVNELPARCKLIFKMVKENDLSCKEVATILGLSDKTVFAQLSIALKKLDKVLCLSENQP